MFSGPVTHLLSVLCVLMKILNFYTQKEDKKAEEFEISQFYWSFSSDLMAVKGLNGQNPSHPVSPMSFMPRPILLHNYQLVD